MNRNIFYLMTLSLSFFCYSLNAATPVEIKKIISSSKMQFRKTFVDKHSLKSIESHQDSKQNTHQRFQQTYQDIPVWDAYLTTHRQISKTIAYGLVYDNLSLDLGDQPANYKDTTKIPSFIEKQYTQYRLSDMHITPLIFVDSQHKAHWAYDIHFLAEQNNSIPLRPHLIIDAKNSIIYLSWNDIKTLDKAKAQGFGGNTHTRKIQYGVNGKPYIEILRDPIREICSMQNAYVSVLNMKSLYSGGQISTFDCKGSQEAYWTGINNDGYDEINEAYSPTNDALFIGTVIHDMYWNWYEVQALGTAEKPRMLTMRVHYGKGYENAFWDGKSMTFGDGGNRMYPLTVLTVGAHEISHGFTEQHSNLVYLDQPGGMNEAFSDMAAQAAEYYLEKKNSWTIGSEIMKEHLNIPALRYMDYPSQDGKSIQHMDQYTPGMDVHYLSGLYNRFFYLLSTSTGWNTKRAFHVMLKANMDYWVPTTNFSTGACGVLWAAEDLDYSLTAIREAFTEVGIETKDC